MKKTKIILGVADTCLRHCFSPLSNFSTSKTSKIPTSIDYQLLGLNPPETAEEGEVVTIDTLTSEEAKIFFAVRVEGIRNLSRKEHKLFFLGYNKSNFCHFFHRKFVKASLDMSFIDHMFQYFSINGKLYPRLVEVRTLAAELYCRAYVALYKYNLETREARRLVAKNKKIIQGFFRSGSLKRPKPARKGKHYKKPKKPRHFFKRLKTSDCFLTLKASKNNIFFTLCLPNGNVVVEGSAGRLGKTKHRKRNIDISIQIIKKIGYFARTKNLRMCYAKIYSPGYNKRLKSILRSLKRTGMSFSALQFCANLAHNGVRPKKKRRR